MVFNVNISTDFSATLAQTKYLTIFCSKWICMFYPLALYNAVSYLAQQGIFLPVKSFP